MAVQKSVDMDFVQEDDDVSGLAGGPVAEDGPVSLDEPGKSGVVDEDIDPDEKLPDNARVNQDGSVTLSLLYPRTVISRKDGKDRNNDFREVTLHRVIGADLEAIAATSESAMMRVMFQRLSRQNPAIVNALYGKLDGADIMAIGQVINHFLPSGQKKKK